MGYFSNNFATIWEAIVFFFYASASGGAMIPTLICKKLEQMGENYKFSPVSILRLLMKATKEVMEKDYAEYNPPLGIEFEWLRWRTKLVYVGTQSSDGVSTTITLEWYQESRRFVVTIEGREKSVEARKLCGFEKKTYEQLPQGFWK